MAANVHIELTVGERQLMRRLAKVEKAFDRIKGKSKKIGSPFKKMSKEMGTFVKSTLGPIAAITALVATIKGAYSDLRQLNQQVIDKTLTFSQARAKVLYNIGGAWGGRKKSGKILDKIVKDTQEETGMGTGVEIMRMMTIIVSSLGTKNDPAYAKEALTEMLKMSKETGDPESASQVVRAAMMMQEAMGVKTLKEAISAALQLQATSPSVKPEDLLKLAPALKIITGIGVPIREGMVKMAYMLQRLGDVNTGVTPRGLAVYYTSIKGKKLYPQEETDQRTGKKKIKWVSVKTATGAETVPEKEKALSDKFIELYKKKDDETMQLILEKFEGRGLVKHGAIVQLLLRNDKYKSDMAVLREKIQKPGGTKDYDLLTEEINKGVGVVIKKTALKETQADIITRGRYGSETVRDEFTYKAIQEALSAGGYSSYGPVGIGEALMHFGKSVIPGNYTDTQLERLRNTRQAISNPDSAGFTGNKGSIAFYEIYKDQVKALDKLIKSIDLSVKSNDRVIETLKANKQQNPSPNERPR